jgi:hypothetical protein
MYTTTVTWPADPAVLTAEKTELEQLATRNRLQQFIDDVVATHGSSYQNIVSQITQPDGKVVVTRNWPDQATAEAWIEIVESLNGNGTYSFT